jgi:23S rRNA pseudouridine1911/1915/1917 synthase
MRLDVFLQQRVPEMSRTRIRRIIDLGGVHLEGRRIRKCGLALSPGQKIEMHLDSGSLEPFRIQQHHVLFQDEFLIALNKPAGINTQPTPARYRGTLYEALQVWLDRDKRHGRRLEIGMAQRLDRDTSGVLVFSIHPRSHKGLSEQIRQRSVLKRYLAVVQGCPEPATGTFRSVLAKGRRSGRMKSVQTGGREAITHYRLLGSSMEASLLELELVTGRTHQIRSHLFEAGYPIVGDSRYGGKQQYAGERFTRQCLHSRSLRLNHPVHGAPLSIEAPVPADMRLERLNLAGFCR